MQAVGWQYMVVHANRHHIGSMQELYRNYKAVYRQRMLIHRQYTGTIQEFA